MNPHPLIRGLAPQASASAYSATRAGDLLFLITSSRTWKTLTRLVAVLPNRKEKFLGTISIFVGIAPIVSVHRKWRRGRSPSRVNSCSVNAVAHPTRKKPSQSGIFPHRSYPQARIREASLGEDELLPSRSARPVKSDTLDSFAYPPSTSLSLPNRHVLNE